MTLLCQCPRPGFFSSYTKTYARNRLLWQGCLGRPLSYRSVTWLDKSQHGSEEEGEPADKPGSVVDSHSSRTLRRRSASSSLPGSARRSGAAEPSPLLPYLALLQVGFAVPSLLPATRCALTAPFHPCQHRFRHFGGLLSVALSVGSRPPGVTWHLRPAEPGLSSPRLHLAARMSGDCLAGSPAHTIRAAPGQLNQSAQNRAISCGSGLARGAQLHGLLIGYAARHAGNLRCPLPQRALAAGP